MGRPKKILVDKEEPKWTCYPCGLKYGSFKAGQARWHQDTCGACGKKDVAVTEPLNFGYFLEGWKEKRDNPEEDV